MIRLLSFLIIILTLFSSCSTTKYIDREVLKTDTLYKSMVSVDSFYVHDSVYMEKETRNDTVFLSKYKVKYRDRVSIKTDTVYKSKVDSVYIDRKVVKTKTDRRGWYAFAIMFAVCGVLVYASVRKYIV